MTVFQKPESHKLKNILILGANGFIGSSLSEYIRDKGYKVRTPSSLECNLLDKESLSHYFSSLIKKYP